MCAPQKDAEARDREEKKNKSHVTRENPLLLLSFGAREEAD
jgi:hypothetical protein